MLALRARVAVEFALGALVRPERAPLQPLVILDLVLVALHGFLREADTRRPGDERRAADGCDEGVAQVVKMKSHLLSPSE
ncbi:MAG: hypothetical protein LC785_17620 [Acidobacteria bacterium]|nr:hypothetical protein [Acidobacteriota bacterium]